MDFSKAFTPEQLAGATLGAMVAKLLSGELTNRKRPCAEIIPKAVAENLETILIHDGDSAKIGESDREIWLSIRVIKSKDENFYHAGFMVTMIADGGNIYYHLPKLSQCFEYIAYLKEEAKTWTAVGGKEQESL